MKNEGEQKMKALKCDMCGSTDIVKQDGLFVCQHCGTKYSIEEAKKMMFEGTVDVSGSTVKVDDSEKISNLYKLARRARDENNAENAQKYYEEIALNNPDDWESNFYKVYYNAIQTKDTELVLSIKKIDASVQSTLVIIKKQLSGEEQKSAYSEVVAKALPFYLDTANTCYDKLMRHGFAPEIKNAITACFKAVEKLGDMTIELFSDRELAAKVYSAIFEQRSSLSVDRTREESKNLMNKIKNNDPSFNYDSALNKSLHDIKASRSSGCYIATAIYGSYDCPEVWILRRYRDNILATTWYGKAFIHSYYAISPFIVKKFGRTLWFKKVWKRKLDNIVIYLKSAGIEDTPYEDKQW